jgi:hypothetical protein
MSGTQRYYNFLTSDRYVQIQNYTPSELERDHSFIQWIFPTTTASAFNSSAPIIDVNDLRSSPEFEDARIKLIQSLELMIKHWGIECSESGLEISNVKNFQLLNGHNGLRFSRVLQSMVYHDFGKLAETLLEFVLLNITLLRPAMHNGKTIWEIRLDEAYNFEN